MTATTKSAPTPAASKRAPATKAPAQKNGGTKAPAHKDGATKPTTTAKPATPPAEGITIEKAMQAISEFARSQGSGWRDSLRVIWSGADDASDLYAARKLVPDAILDNLSFKPPRKQRELTPEQDAARRLRAVGKTMRAKARALQARAKEASALARQLRQKDSPKEVAAAMAQLADGAQLAALEAEAAL